MVEVSVDKEDLVFTVQGLHKLWAFKSSVRVPIGSVRSVARDADAKRGMWKGIRFPGTHIPGLIVAGTFYQRHRKSFWDVTNAANTIVVETHGGPYDRIVVDVSDPRKTVQLIESVLTRA